MIHTNRAICMGNYVGGIRNASVPDQLRRRSEVRTGSRAAPEGAFPSGIQGTGSVTPCALLSGGVGRVVGSGSRAIGIAAFKWSVGRTAAAGPAVIRSASGSCRRYGNLVSRARLGQEGVLAHQARESERKC